MAIKKQNSRDWDGSAQVDPDETGNEAERGSQGNDREKKEGFALEPTFGTRFTFS